jgi:hypothetical protein
MKTGIITWSDKTISKVFIKEIEVYSQLRVYICCIIKQNQNDSRNKNVQRLY